MRGSFGRLVALAALSAAGFAHAQPITLPDGRSINLLCAGQGAPTVVLESGLGLPVETWQRVQSQLAVTHRTCAYNRAGYPGSGAGPMPRDAAHAADDLAAVLRVSGLPGPYVLVGHSYGADVVRLYAARHPRAVKGLVLVDAQISGEARRIAAVSPAIARVQTENEDVSRRCIGAVASGTLWKADDPAYAPCGPPPPPGSPLADRVMAQAVLSELDNLDASDAQVASATSGPAAFPIVALTADRSRQPPPDASKEELAAVVSLLAGEHAAIAAGSRLGVQRVIRQTGHLIQLDQPEAVVAAVEEVAR